MKEYQFPEGCLFINKSRILNCFEIEVGMEILGFNRNRKLCWSKVDEANKSTDASCCRLWTNRGDSPFSPKNTLISPSGPKTVDSIKKEFCAGEIIQIEMPGLKDITKFICKENNLTADILIEVLKLNVLSDLKKLINALKSKMIIPIHSFHSEKFQEFFPNVRLVKDREVLEF